MTVWATLNRGVFKRTSTFTLAVAVGAFFFERTLDMISQSIYQSINRGKFWDDVKDRFKVQEVVEKKKVCT